MRSLGHAALRRLALETLGWGLVLVGIAALVLPGPGLLAIFAGLALLSRQYEWAKRHLEPVKERAWQAATDSVATWPRIIASCTGAALLVAIGVVWCVRPDAPGWWPWRESWWLIGGWSTGLTQIGSGLIAFATIVYSYRRFR
ncbi:PGPGW domain-containing protein [Nocardioides sp.]|uniref:PGPGW domain-containing protein n=1 Tax=Nocardioides sp. TaxID=35761 RepID=UPI003565C8B2